MGSLNMFRYVISSAFQNNLGTCADPEKGVRGKGLVGVQGGGPEISAKMWSSDLFESVTQGLGS